MTTSCRLAACLVSLWALTGAAFADPVLNYGISSPVVHDNLAVYFVHGNGTGSTATAPLTLDQAVGSGQAKLRWTDLDTPVTVENLSDHSIFIPFATLLTGGLQDQVTSTSVVLPPHSGPIPLATFCVDPFRSAARDGEDPATLATGGLVFPGRAAKLAMLVAGPQSKAVERMRQAGVWWNIDTTRSELSRRLGGPVEPPRQVHWNTDRLQQQISSAMLAARQSSSITSLPLALENLRLQNAEQAYVDDIEATAEKADDIIGAVFAVNGSVDGAEIYRSHALFAAMWPRLLRAHAIEAIAGTDVAQEAAAAPPVPAVQQFLTAAEAGTARQQGKGQYSVLRDSDAAIYAETRAGDGGWINRSFLARSAPVAGAPETAILNMIETGRVDGRPLASLGDRAFLMMRRDPAGAWSGVIREGVPRFDFGVPWSHVGRDAESNMLMPGLMAISFFAFLFWLAASPRRARNDFAIPYRVATSEAASFTFPQKGERGPDREHPRFVPVPTRRAGAAIAAAQRDLAAGLTALGGSARHTALRHLATLAAWRAAIQWGEMVRPLGPAWPGNFRPPPRMAVPVVGRARLYL